MTLSTRPWITFSAAALFALNGLEALPKCNAASYSLNAVGGDSGVTTWQTAKFTAHAELAPGTIAPVYYPFTFYVYYVVEVSTGVREVNALQFSAHANGDIDTGSVQVGLAGGYVNPFFTMTGTSDGNVYDGYGQIVGTADAPSFRSLHTYSPTYSGHETLTADMPVVVSFNPKGCQNPSAAGLLKPEVDSLNVSISLGSGGNGSHSGLLRVQAETASSALATPKSIEAISVTSDFEVLKISGTGGDAGNLRQVLTPAEASVPPVGQT